MKILGIDYGLKKVGVAFSASGYASPIAVVDTKEVFLRLKNICQEYTPELIVIGITSGKFKPTIIGFGKELEKILNIKVVYQDESLTSKMAQAQMHTQQTTNKKIKKEKEHKIAAALILQDYIDNN